MNKGQTTLSLIFLISGVIITIGVMLAVLGIAFVTSITGYQARIRAEAAANAGIEDGIMQVVRNVTFTYGSPGYTVPVTNATVNVTITTTQTDPTTNLPSQDTIISLAQVGTYKQKIQAVVSIDKTLRVGVISYQNLSL